MSGRFRPKREMNFWGKKSFWNSQPLSLLCVPKVGDRVLFLCVFSKVSGEGTVRSSARLAGGGQITNSEGTGEGV